MAQQQVQLQMKMKMLDDVFHRTIIALERLELFLESENYNKSSLKATGIKTERDLHDDYLRPPTKESYYGEAQLQCTSLYFQTEFDDKELFEKTAKYFLQDLFEWYGGRGEDIVPNDVEKFFIPIAVVVNRQISSVLDVTKTVTEYVCDIASIESFTEEEKMKAVRDGFAAWIKADNIIKTEMQDFVNKGMEVKLSSHTRGSIEDGIKRLSNSFKKLYNEKAPSLLLSKIATYYFPDIVANISDLNENGITEYFNTKNN